MPFRLPRGPRRALIYPAKRNSKRVNPLNFVYRRCSKRDHNANAWPSGLAIKRQNDPEHLPVAGSPYIRPLHPFVIE